MKSIDTLLPTYRTSEYYNHPELNELRDILQNMASIETNNKAKSKAHRRVLLIDDDRDFGALALNIAESYAIPMDYVASLDGVKSLDLESYDSIILDYHLQDSTGMEVGHFLDTVNANKPVILTSGLNFWEVDPTVWPRCVQQFIPKNAGLSTLILSAYRLAMSA